MASFELLTNGIEVGYSDGTFFAFGTSTAHKFENSDWQFSTPPIGGMPVSWSINLKNENPFKRYVEYTYPLSELSPRVPLLQDYFSEIKCEPVGQLRRWEKEEPINLSYSFPNDPSLTAFIMGVVAADREMSIWGQGWMFLDGDELAPAVTRQGFMERKEPAFTLNLPVLRVR